MDTAGRRSAVWGQPRLTALPAMEAGGAPGATASRRHRRCRARRCTDARHLAALSRRLRQPIPTRAALRLDAANRYKLTLADFDAQLAGVRGVRSDAPAPGRGDCDRARTTSRQTRRRALSDHRRRRRGLLPHLIAERLERRGWRGHCFVSTDCIGRRGFLSRDADPRAGAARPRHRQPLGLTSEPVQRAAVRRDGVGMVAQPRDSRGHPRPRRSTSASVPGGYFSARRRARRTRGWHPRAVHLGAGHARRCRRRHADRRPLHHPPRRSARPRAASRLRLAPWARSRAWASWNAKGLVKPLLGPVVHPHRRLASGHEAVERDVVTMGFIRTDSARRRDPAAGRHPAARRRARSRRRAQRPQARRRPNDRAAASSCRPTRRAVAPCTSRAGDSLQAALDAAQPGDRITLDPGATYTGPFRLLRKTGDQWIVITSAGPAPAARAAASAPSDAAQMPRLVAEGNIVIEAMPGAHHYRLVGLEVAPADGTLRQHA